MKARKKTDEREKNLKREKDKKKKKELEDEREEQNRNNKWEKKREQVTKKKDERKNKRENYLNIKNLPSQIFKAQIRHRDVGVVHARPRPRGCPARCRCPFYLPVVKVNPLKIKYKDLNSKLQIFRR